VVSSNQVTLWAYQTGNFSSIIWSTNLNNTGFDAAIADLDGDGHLDLAIATEGYTRVYLNNADGSFKEISWFSQNTTIGIELGNFDDDEDFDLYVTRKEGGENKIYKNNGGSFSSTASLGFPFPSDFRDRALGDLDGDGDLDAIEASANRLDGLALHNGSGYERNHGIALPTDPNTAAAHFGIDLGDLDGDGDLDAVLAVSNGAHLVYFNTGLTPAALLPMMDAMYLEGENLVINFSGESNWTYALQMSTNLLDPDAWVTIESNLVIQGESGQVTQPAACEASEPTYYRLQATFF